MSAPEAGADGAPTGGDRRRTRRRRVLGVVAGLGLAVLLAGAVAGLQYRRQIWSYLTHWKGSPTSTVAYRAPAPDTDLHVAVAGDIGDSGTRLDATADAIARIGASDPYQVLLLLGDNVYPDGDPAELPNTVFTPFATTLEDAHLLAILGNHDEGYGRAQMRALGMPGRWWAYETDDVLFVGLDSNDVGNRTQRRFLDDTLAASTATWKIVAVHHPPYSAGYQGSSEDVRQTYSPLFEEHGVQLVLSGHDHDYQRSKEIDGVTYVVSGAASGTRRTGTADFTAESFSWHHFLDLAIGPDRLVGQAVNQDGRVADRFVLRP